MEIIHENCRVMLRSININDINLFNSEIELSTDYLRLSDILWLPHNPESLELSISNMINSQQMMQFPNILVIVNEQGFAAGVISTHSFDNKHGLFSYGISLLNVAQGKGYAYEAVNLLLYHMFYTRGYNKCLANTYQFNSSSIKLQQKIGFKYEGILQNGYYCEGRFYDIYIWGLDKNSFKFMHCAQKTL